MKIQRLPVKCIVLIALSVIMGMQFWAWVRDAAAAEAGYIDTHNHAPMTATCIYDMAYDEQIKTIVLDAMDDFDIQKTFFMPPPHTLDNVPCGYQHLAEIAKRRRDRFAFLLGGESLNPMIHSVKPDEVTDQISENFRNKAIEILQSGAIGFGEMAAEHFSLHAGHPHMSAAPDHPLFLRLAKIAAEHDVPIDLHMEALESNTAFADLPFECSAADENHQFANPDVFPKNIEAFESLLRYNRNARIVWVHAGWDNTGRRTVGLTRRLLNDHTNLYIQLRPLPRRSPGRCNPIVDDERNIGEEWLDLISSFPNRFTIGLDSFYSPFKEGLPDDFFKPYLRLGKDFVEQLYEKLRKDVADKVAFENAIRIYRLDQIMVCHGHGTSGQQSLRVDAGALQGHVAHGDTLGPCAVEFGG